MLIELTLFLAEITLAVAYPGLLTLKVLSSHESKNPTEFQSLAFYWIAFIVVNGLGWTLTCFPFDYLRPLALIALALPQLSLSLKISNYVLGPLQDLLYENFAKSQELIKSKLA